MASNGKLEGVDVVVDRSRWTKAGKRPRRKPTLDELERRAELLARVSERSAKIRRERGSASAQDHAVAKCEAEAAMLRGARPAEVTFVRVSRSAGARRQVNRAEQPGRERDRPADVLRYIGVMAKRLETEYAAAFEPVSNFYRVRFAAELEARRNGKRAPKRAAKPQPKPAAAKPPQPKPQPAPQPVAINGNGNGAHAGDLTAEIAFRLKRAQLVEIGGEIAAAELERRRAKRAAKRERAAA